MLWDTDAPWIREGKNLHRFSVLMAVIVLLFCVKVNRTRMNQSALAAQSISASEKNILDFIDQSFHGQIQSGIYTTLDSELITLAIQKAFDSMPSGGTIYFPVGRYIVTRGFQLFDQST